MINKKSKRPFVVRAHAKINRHLAVGKRKPNGYHDLESIFQEISLHDKLKFQPIPKGFQLASSSRQVPVDSTNLVIKALKALQRKLKAKSGFSVYLTKNIPVGAGLGGGSSDAAAALKAGWQQWRGNVLDPRKGVPPVLSQIASSLGADVSFFLKGGRAWAEGKGDRLISLKPTSHEWLVIIYPRIHVSTAKAYAWLDQSRKKNQINFGNFAPLNSFEGVIFHRYPKIFAAYQKLVENNCENVRMSGSGSAVFGMVPSQEKGQRILQKLKRQPWDVFLVHTR